MSGQARWVLAFDASCRTCRRISAAVRQACEGELEVLPLAQPDVEQWRAQALGPNPPWAPTLLRIEPDDLRGWTGPAMAVRLTRLMGLRPTVRVLRALGDLARAGVDGERRGGLSRASFLRLGVGAVIAGGFIVSGRTPALAASSASEAAEWVAVNKDRLPMRYDEVITYPMPYRKAIFSASPASVKRTLWLEHLDRFRGARRDLTGDQLAVLRQATAALDDPALFDEAGALPARVTQGHSRLQEAAIAAYGFDDARALVATLGPAQATANPDCQCSALSNWCSGTCSVCCWSGACGQRCMDVNHCCCVFIASDCGTFWRYDCSGLCGDY
jgi:hypothetical protein